MDDFVIEALRTRESEPGRSKGLSVPPKRNGGGQPGRVAPGRCWSAGEFARVLHANRLERNDGNWRLGFWAAQGIGDFPVRFGSRVHEAASMALLTPLPNPKRMGSRRRR